jgi:hypothetical protein
MLRYLIVNKYVPEKPAASSVPNMDATGSSETLIPIYQALRCHILFLEDGSRKCLLKDVTCLSSYIVSYARRPK